MSALARLGAALAGMFRSGTAERLVELALERTEDVDKRHALVLDYFRMKEETRRAELARVTVPWVDALHKMGRQLYWAGATAGVLVLIGMGRGAELAQHAELLLAALGGGGLYTALKGKGQ